MNNLMNPQRGSKRPNTVNPAGGEWGFVECKLLILVKLSVMIKLQIFLAALISRHAPEPSATPMKIKCPTCNQKIESLIETETYSKTHFWAAGNRHKLNE